LSSFQQNYEASSPSSFNIFSLNIQYIMIDSHCIIIDQFKFRSFFAKFMLFINFIGIVSFIFGDYSKHVWEFATTRFQFFFFLILIHCFIRYANRFSPAEKCVVLHFMETIDLLIWQQNKQKLLTILKSTFTKITKRSIIESLKVKLETTQFDIKQHDMMKN
jgi:hypothetical protein